MIAALLTAAGASTRMGRPKALVVWQGAPLLLHQARALADAGVAPIVVVLGSEAATIRAEAATWPLPGGVVLVDNPRWPEGRSTSLEVGAATLVQACRADLGAVFVMAVDQPLAPATMAALAAAMSDDDEVLAPVHAGRRGHPIVLCARLVASALTRATVYPEGLRDIVRGARVREVAVDDAAIHLDLNSPDDLAAARR